MKIRNILASLLLASLAQEVVAETMTFSAQPGNFSGGPVRKAATTNEIAGTVQIRDYHPDPAWPPAAYMGMYQGEDRNNSIQFVVTRNEPSDNHLMAGYRLVVGGKEQKIASIGKVRLDKPVQVRLSFNKGIATVRVNQFMPVEVATPFSSVATYVSVSSAEAEFNINP